MVVRVISSLTLFSSATVRRKEYSVLSTEFEYCPLEKSPL